MIDLRLAMACADSALVSHSLAFLKSQSIFSFETGRFLALRVEFWIVLLPRHFLVWIFLVPLKVIFRMSRQASWTLTPLSIRGCRLQVRKLAILNEF